MSTRLTSRCALALIQIWASDATASSFAHCVGFLTAHARLRTLLDQLQLRPRRAFWQAITIVSWPSRLSLSIHKLSSSLPAGGGPFIPMSKARSFLARKG